MGINLVFSSLRLRPGDFPAGNLPECERLQERDGAGGGVQDLLGRRFRHLAVPHAAPQHHALLHDGEKSDSKKKKRFTVSRHDFTAVNVKQQRIGHDVGGW